MIKKTLTYNWDVVPFDTALPMYQIRTRYLADDSAKKFLFLFLFRGEPAGLFGIIDPNMIHSLTFFLRIWYRVQFMVPANTANHPRPKAAKQLQIITHPPHFIFAVI